MEKVLIVVDMQKGFMEHQNYQQLSKKINDYISSHSYDKIFLTKFINKKDSFFECKTNWTKLQSEHDQDFSIDVPKGAVVLEKYGFGLQEKDVDMLKKLDVDQVDICGLQTDACVYAISLQLFDNGIFPNILINYVATDPKREKVAKEMLIHQFGKVDETI